MTNRDKMYNSNAIAKDWLFAHGYDHVVIFGHHKTRRGGGMTWTYKKNGKREMQRTNDLWRLFDGICLNNITKTFIPIQIKTNSFGTVQHIADFMKGTLQQALIINVVNRHCRVKLIDNSGIREITPNISKHISRKTYI